MEANRDGERKGQVINELVNGKVRKNLAQTGLLKVLSAFTDITVIALRVLEGEQEVGF